MRKKKQRLSFGRLRFFCRDWWEWKRKEGLEEKLSNMDDTWRTFQANLDAKWNQIVIMKSVQIDKGDAKHIL